MYHKSLIQQIREGYESQLSYNKNFKEAIEQLQEKYNIEDASFVYENDLLIDVKPGFYRVVNTYHDLDSIFENMQGKCAVRVCKEGYQILEPADPTKLNEDLEQIINIGY